MEDRMEKLNDILSRIIPEIKIELKSGKRSGYIPGLSARNKNNNFIPVRNLDPVPENFLRYDEGII
jgi:hypothetical protein